MIVTDAGYETRDKWRVAVHEAAHAVIALDTGGVARVRLKIGCNDGEPRP
jgi:hypothetical protein